MLRCGVRERKWVRARAPLQAKGRGRAARRAPLVAGRRSSGARACAWAGDGGRQLAACHRNLGPTSSVCFTL
jgi:hypothetical protein